jgi:hypothetical protein
MCVWILIDIVLARVDERVGSSSVIAGRGMVGDSTRRHERPYCEENDFCESTGLGFLEANTRELYVIPCIGANKYRKPSAFKVRAPSQQPDNTAVNEQRQRSDFNSTF